MDDMIDGRIAFIVRACAQGDGFIELRMDWKVEKEAKCALLRVNPWLSYGCSEGCAAHPRPARPRIAPSPTAHRASTQPQSLAAHLRRTIAPAHLSRPIVLLVLLRACGSARLAMRKPDQTEGRCATVQRTLRDDSVVVRIDGMIGETTVDPTPLTVVRTTSPRHELGTRLLLLHEGACVDAVVEPWPEPVMDVKEVP